MEEVPPLVTLIFPQQQQDEEDTASATRLRSCFGSSSLSSARAKEQDVGPSHVAHSSTTTTDTTHCRPVVHWQEPCTATTHEPPAALLESLAHHAPDLWYTGNDIRRMKQACLPIIAQLDAKNQPKPRAAVEVDWINGTTSLRGLEFGTRDGQQRRRATRHYQRIVLEAHAQLRQARRENGGQDDLPALSEEEKKEEQKASVVATPPGQVLDQDEALAAVARQASQDALHRALDTATQDADFVCRFVENVTPHPSVVSPRRPPVRPLAVVRRVLRTIVPRNHFSSSFYGPQRHGRPRTSQPPKDSTAKCCDGRHRCDTESTATLMAQSSA